MEDDSQEQSQEPAENESRVGGPLYLGEARFLAQALKGRGIKRRIYHDASLGQPRDPIHFVIVRSRDCESAMSIRDEVLGTEEERTQEKAEEAAGRKGILWKALTAGLLGILVGFRVGIKFRVGPWPVLFPPLLGIFSFLAVLMLWPGPNESPPEKPE